MCMAEIFLFRPGTLALYHTRTAVVKAVNGDKLEIAIEGGGSKMSGRKIWNLYMPDPFRR